MKMTRLLLGCFVALCVGFVSGCGGGGGENTVIEAPAMTDADVAAADAAYEAEMEAGGGDEEPGGAP